MTQKLLPIGEYVDHLRAFEKEPLTRDRLLQFCLETAVDPHTLDRYVHFRERHVHAEPGSATSQPRADGRLLAAGAAHGHPYPQRPARLDGRAAGHLAVVNYKYLGCNAADNQNVSGLDCLAGATELEIDRRDVQECYPGGPVNTVDKVQTIHQVVVQGREPVISLHIYSRPIDSCVAFDLEQRSATGGSSRTIRSTGTSWCAKATSPSRARFPRPRSRARATDRCFAPGVAMSSADSAEAAPDLRYAWYVAIVLMVCNTLSFIDRQILGLLVTPIKQELGISDTSIGLLQGLAFGLFYTLLGLPMGRIADRGNRRMLVVVGVFSWSLMTAMCAGARTFWTLFLARMEWASGSPPSRPRPSRCFRTTFRSSAWGRPSASSRWASSSAPGWPSSSAAS